MLIYLLISLFVGFDITFYDKEKLVKVYTFLISLFKNDLSQNLVSLLPMVQNQQPCLSIRKDTGILERVDNHSCKKKKKKERNRQYKSELDFLSPLLFTLYLKLEICSGKRNDRLK